MKTLISTFRINSRCIADERARSVLVAVIEVIRLRAVQMTAGNDELRKPPAINLADERCRGYFWLEKSCSCINVFYGFQDKIGAENNNLHRLIANLLCCIDTSKHACLIFKTITVSYFFSAGRGFSRVRRETGGCPSNYFATELLSHFGGWHSHYGRSKWLGLRQKSVFDNTDMAIASLLS